MEIGTSGPFLPALLFHVLVQDKPVIFIMADNYPWMASHPLVGQPGELEKPSVISTGERTPPEGQCQLDGSHLRRAGRGAQPRGTGPAFPR